MYMHTVTVHAYSHCTCKQSLYMHTNTVYAYSHCTCIQTLYMHTVNVYAYSQCTCILCIVVQLDEMYDMCRFDKAWNIRQTSPWCAVFSKEELQVCVTNLRDFYFLVYTKYIQNTAAFQLHVDNFNT